MPKIRSGQDPDESVTRVRLWLKSAEGKKRIAVAVDDGLMRSEEMAKKRCVSVKQLREPFTV